MQRWIIGIHSIEELLKAAPERCTEILWTKAASARTSLAELIKRHKILAKVVSKEVLSKKVGTDFHQGVIAHVQKMPSISLQELLDDLIDQPRAIILVLDRIYDPHNLGAILRSAECFQVDGVIWSKNRGADITPVVTKTSSGASELIRTIKVSNLADALKKMQKMGFEVISAEVSEKSQSLFTHTFSPKTALIMGSEGEGIQPLLSKLSDKSLYIPMKGQIDSLNVSQATAVMLSAWSQSS